MFVKNSYINLAFGMPGVQSCFYNIPYVFFVNFEYVKLLKKLYRNFAFLLFGYKSCLGKSEISILKNSLFDVFWYL